MSPLSGWRGLASGRAAGGRGGGTMGWVPLWVFWGRGVVTWARLFAGIRCVLEAAVLQERLRRPPVAEAAGKWWLVAEGSRPLLSRDRRRQPRARPYNLARLAPSWF